MRHPAVRLCAVLSVVALAASGCGGDDSEDTPTTGGLQVAASHDEIVEKAKAEGPFTIVWTRAADLEDDPTLLDSFYEQYPFMKGRVTVENQDGVEARQRFLLEVEAGAQSDYAAGWTAVEIYDEMTKLCDWDVYGMAQSGVLDIPLEMVDPNKRTVVAAGSTAAVFGYNKAYFQSHPLPKTWDELLDPAVYGQPAGFRMLADVRAANFSALVEKWGLDKAKEYYGKLASDIKPTWVQRFAGPSIQMAQGEFQGFPFVNASSIAGRQADNPGMDIALIDPVPIYITETHCVFKNSMNNAPYSGLLWLEWTASQGGQKALESKSSPYRSHFSSDYPGGLADLVKGHELSICTWGCFEQQQKYIEEIIGAAGFPKATDGG